MADPYSPLIEVHGRFVYPEPFSGPTSKTIQHGLIPLGLLALLSVVSSLTLIAFILWRVYSTRTEDNVRKFVGRNQYVLLVLNLLIADLQQGVAFLFSFHWYSINYILAPYGTCFAQGWLLHSGDVSSGFFVLAIAVHTYYTAVHGRRVGHKTFAAIIAAIWLFAYLLTAIGPALHGYRFFVKAGAWCWVSSHYEQDRLSLHYVWVFIVEFSTIVIYLLTFSALRRKTKLAFSQGRLSADSPTAATMRSINRVTMLMVLYPFVYVILTLPLSSGRMWSMSHHGKPTSDTYSIIAGCLLTSCGWVDSLLYTLTRSRLLTSSQARHGSERLPSTPFSPVITQTKTVTVTTSAFDDEPAHEMVVSANHMRHNPANPRYQRPTSPTESTNAILQEEGLVRSINSAYLARLATADMEKAYPYRYR